MTLQRLKSDLREVASKDKAEGLRRFFKTGPGEYGEGDIFLGVMVPDTRRLVRKYQADLSWKEVEDLTRSGLHEERLLGLLVLVKWYEKGEEKMKKKVFDFYLKNRRYVNNWDLVDLTAPRIVGDYLYRSNKREMVYEMVRSENLWMKRIGVLACSAFIQKGSEKEIFDVAKVLLKDKHDLIHKAVGWMLREVGKKRGLEAEEKFVADYVLQMPRTMLRYAIEKFPEEKRRQYLRMK